MNNNNNNYNNYYYFITIKLNLSTCWLNSVSGCYKASSKTKTKHKNSTNTQKQNSKKQHKKYDHNDLIVEFLEILRDLTEDKNK